MKNNERGAAIIETAIALPVLLLALYAVSWSVRVGAISERAETAVRYAGVVSAQQDSFHDYSLYTLYNNLGNTDYVKTLACTGPTSLYVSGGVLPTVPGSPQKQAVLPKFWLPDSGSVQSYCLNSSGRQTFAGQTRPYLLLQSDPNLNATVSEDLLLGHLGGATISSSMKFYRAADLSTVMHCVPVLNAAISGSLNPSKYSKNLPVRPLLPSDFNPAPPPVTTDCANAVGSQTPAPTPPPYTPRPGRTPVQSPGPGQSPSAQPSTSPSPTAKPSASPTSKPTQKPTPSPEPSGSGSPSPKPTGSPTGKPSPHPTGSPTGKPTQKPTPKPTAPPTAPPTKKPTPTPTPQPSGTPGNIF